MSFISFTCFCISFRTSFIEFCKFYNVLYVSRTGPARWASPGPIPWPRVPFRPRRWQPCPKPPNRTCNAEAVRLHIACPDSMVRHRCHRQAQGTTRWTTSVTVLPLWPAPGPWNRNNQRGPKAQNPQKTKTYSRSPVSSACNSLHRPRS